jgi:hypothetical protein
MFVPFGMLRKPFLVIVSVTVVMALGACDYEAMVESYLEKKSEPVTTEEGFLVYDDVQPNYYGADPDKPVVLINKRTAINPTWDQLKSFLLTDTTDENDYLPGIRVCAEFAAELHNNAEAAGIKAAWVSIDFEGDSKGHALNAFNTTDCGLVFIDCTGGIPSVQLPTYDEETGELIEETECFTTNDKKAYVQLYRQCGFIGLDISADFDYESYLKYVNEWEELKERNEVLVSLAEAYKTKLKAYERQVEEYERLVGGRTVIEDHTEYDMLNEMSKVLNSTRSELELQRNQLMHEAYLVTSAREDLGNCRREPLGVVKRVEIYW